MKIEIGRAGLVVVTLVLPDGSIRTFVIQDLDADPERFNERLSKLAILRDAMDHAEPVEIEFKSGEGGDAIERCVRISRDLLDPIGAVQQVTGLVLAILVHAENGATAQGEKHDQAIVQLITTDMQPVALTLDLQIPERGVALAQLDMLRDAEQRGVLVRLLVTGAAAGGSPSEIGVGVGIRGFGQRIVAVLLDDDESAFGSDQAEDLNGFVESLSLIRLPLAGESALGNFAHVRFTTAPPFTGPGNTVGLVPFGPVTVDLLVPKNSPAYALFEAGLRDNLRMRVRAVNPRATKPRDPNTPTGDQPSGRPVAVRVRGTRGTRGGSTPAAEAAPDVTGEAMTRLAAVVATRAAALGDDKAQVFLVFAAELLAPLASASRPVWITVWRDSLDHGPDASAALKETPTSDLRPRTLRDLHIPYPAVWQGLGCFNHGVYRFQFQLPTPFRALLDGEALTLFESDTPGIYLAHACIEGDHLVTVEIDAWTCDYEFVMDVYRLR